MSLSLRTMDEAFARARYEHASRTQNWTGMCQKFTRTIWGIGPLFGSAAAQWHGTDPDDKHPGTDPDKAPVGSALCYLGGSEGFGHIMPAARPFPSGREAAWSNDLVRTGFIDKVGRHAPVTKWGQRYVGYITAVNDVDLRMPQKHRYGALAAAIERLGVARDTARAGSDAEDVVVLDREIARLQKLYDTLRHV